MAGVEVERLESFACNPEELGNREGIACVTVRALLAWAYPGRQFRASEVPALLMRMTDALERMKHQSACGRSIPVSMGYIPLTEDCGIWDETVEFDVTDFGRADLDAADWRRRMLEVLRSPAVTQVH